MQLHKWTSLTILASVVHAQSIATLVGQIPSCALSCLTTAFSAAGCGLTDYVCQCTNPGHAIIIQQAAGCISSACSTSDALTTSNITNEICAAALASGTPTAAASTASSAASVAASTAQPASPATSSAQEASQSPLSSASSPSITTSSASPSFTSSINPSITVSTTPSTISSVSSSAPSTPAPAPASTSSSTDHTAVIAGSVVGGVIGLAAIAAIAIYFIMRLRSQNRTIQQQNNAGEAALESEPGRKQELAANVPMELDSRQISANF